MNEKTHVFGGHRNRRNFLKNSVALAGTAGLGTALLAGKTSVFAQSQGGGHTSEPTEGDIAILRFLAAGEILEADFWTQYNELGGLADSEVPGGNEDHIYREKLRRIDRNFPQYIHDNTDDEISHANFLNAYLLSK